MCKPQEKAWITKLWVYDFRTNKHFTPKQNMLRRAEFEQVISLFKPGAIHKRNATWSEAKPDGRCRCFRYDKPLKRDKLSFDLFRRGGTPIELFTAGAVAISLNGSWSAFRNKQ